MNRSKPSPLGRDKVSIRVLLSKKDYEELRKIAELEREIVIPSRSARSSARWV